jgi:outer membrane protein assembly factor BamB
VHINVICPSCGTRYRLEPDMRGKRTRCPNASCRAVFEVREEDEAAPSPTSAPEPPPPGRPVSGSVSDLLPVLTAEQVSPAEPPPPRPKKKSEPGLRTRATPAPEVVPAAAQAPVLAPDLSPAPGLDWGPLSDFFAEQPSSRAAEGASAEPDVIIESSSGAWEPPPIRGAGAPLPDGLAKKEETIPPPALAAPQATRRRTWRAIGLMAAAVAALGGALFWQYHRQRTGNEAQRVEIANERFRDHNFEDAAARFSKLAADFPDSPAQRQYRFAAEFSGLREPIYQTQTDAGELTNAFKRLRDFVAGYQGDPLRDLYEADLWHTFAAVSKSLLDAAEEKHNPELAKQAEQALEQATTFKALPARERQALRDRLAHVNQDIAAWTRKQDVLKQLKAVLSHFTFEGRQKALQAVDHAGLRNDSEVAALLAQLPAKHRSSVTYHEAKGKPATLPREDQEPTLLVLPLLKEGAAELGDDRRPVLALVNGVLYAFDPAGNELRWFRRVSIDSPGLPARVPPSAMTPELILAFLPDNSTLTALEARQGKPVWCCPLRSSCLGKPLVVGRRIFLATTEGYVDEIDADSGLRLGSYWLGQPLTGDGVHQPGTSLLYFPADQDTVYVLDVAARTCTGILYTGHPAGSLRGAPVLILEATRGPTERAARASLVLSQEEGMDRIKLRVFPLPEATASPATDPWETTLRGWACFPPFADSERLAQVTDRGHFVLYGVGPRARGGPYLFRRVPEDVLLGGSQGSRALVVHADPERFWVLADGELHKLVLTFDRREGPQLVQPPLAETAFGSALHAGQVRTDGEGKTTLYLVTRARDDQTSLLSAVDARRGTLAWQRQVGLLCRGQPRRLGDQMLIEDQAGSLYLFTGDDLKRAGEQRDVSPPWVGGQKLPGPASSGSRYFLRGPEQTLYVITALAGEPPSVQVQQFLPGKTTSQTSTFPQQAPLGGTPAVATDALVLPLTNGALARQSLSGGPAVAGPNWRAARADADSPGHIVLLEKDEFLVTDGSRGLKRLRWPAGSLAESKASVELPSRIVRPPLVLPPAKTGVKRICVADAADTLTLLQGDTLRPIRQWNLGGKITAGPFLRGKSMGCVVDHRRLVWLNPDKGGITWQYGPFDGDIVGEPQLVGEDLVVVADVSGRFIGFHPATGQIQGRGYTLRANVAPAAAPQSWGAGRLFAPLTDGTILLLSTEHFHSPL